MKHRVEDQDWTANIPCWKFHTQVVLVYFQPFRRNSPLKCVSQPETPYFGVSWSFKVINVDISKKLVASACYDKQHVCAYLQSFSPWRSQ